ncbi:magnesium/cobalt transporter CorA [Bacteroidota bacterium]
MKMRKIFSIKKSDPNHYDFVGIKYLEKAEIQVFTYNDEEHYEYSNFEDIDTIPDLLQSDKIFWLNVHGIHDVSIIQKICEKLNLHSLIPKKIIDTDRFSRLIEMDSEFYFGITSLLINENNQIESEKISFVLGEKYLLTFQEKKGDHFEHVRNRIRNKLGSVRLRKTDFLLFLLLESIIDNYSITLHGTETEIDSSLETNTEINGRYKKVVALEALKERLHLMKKSLLPVKDTLKYLSNGQITKIDKNNLKYYNSITDWCYQLYEEIDFNIQKIESGINLIFSQQSQRMNEIMKTLTIVAAIFIPLTFIAGIYGMNFEFMPELKWDIGYYITLSSMAVLIIIMLIYFKFKKWF